MNDVVIQPLPPGRRARVVAVVRALRLDAVVESLAAGLAGAGLVDLVIEQVRGYGRQKEHLQFYEGVGTWQGNFLPKVRLELTVEADALDTAVNAIRRAAHTGRLGDGKIFVHPVEPADGARPGERATAAGARGRDDTRAGAGGAREPGAAGDRDAARGPGDVA